MPTLGDLQQEIQKARAKLAADDDAYYQALQQWSLSGTGAERLESLRQARAQSQSALDDAIARLAKLGDPGALIQQVSADFPFLLMPLRLEARYLIRRHILRNPNPDDLVDGSTIPLVSQLLNSGFEPDDEGVLTYAIPALHALRSPLPQSQPLRDAALQVKSGKFIRQKPDREELWIRIYPDEVFTEAFEKNLQPSEAEAGRAFWETIWAGGDPEEAWLALADRTTAPRAAWIVRATRPTNFQPGSTPSGSPQFPAVPLKDGPYTRAPVARLLPERFVVRVAKGNVVKEFVGRPVPEPLPLGLDPTLDPTTEDPDAAFTSAGTVLKAPAPLRWVHDLEAAEKAGLALRIDLAEHPQFRDGVDSIIVLGAKFSAAPDEAARLLNAHFENCLYKEKGLSLLPQGTPTNRSGAETDLSADETLPVFRAFWTPSASSGSDEARLRKALGLADTFRIPNGATSDVEEALRMNRLLWPATLGYYLLEFFTPALPEAAREQALRFFSTHVAGRGCLPILRINNQPYGLLPVSSFEEWSYPSENRTEEEQFLSDFWRLVLSRLRAQWQVLARRVVIETNAAASSHRLDEPFLRMLGLNASSVQFQKQALAGPGLQEVLRVIQPSAIQQFTNDPAFKPANRAAALRSAGFNPAHFETLNASYSSSADRRKLRWHTVDALPLSEEHGLQRLPEKAWNYLEWLAQAPVEQIWKLDFSAAPSGDTPFHGNAAAVTLFARICRQAVLRTFLEAGLRKTEPNPGLWLLKVKDFEPDQLHDKPIEVNPAALSADNRLHQIYKPIIEKHQLTAPFTIQPDRWKYLEPIAPQLDQPGDDPALREIREMKAALAEFSRLPTARLERLFAEHLDLCSHRLDAWLLGLAHQRLQKQRRTNPSGIHLGAFGWLLDLKPAAQRAVCFVETEPEYIPATPENLKIAAVPVVNLALAKERGLTPDQNWDRAFFYIGQVRAPGAQLNTRTGHVEPGKGVNDPKSHGFLHAPSPSHAAAAAILYSGHLSHKEETASQSLAVKLNASRTRLALELLQGLQQGASLPELLGYHLERSIHDHGLDAFLTDVRQAFPLRRAELAGAAIQPAATTDGLAVIEASRKKPPPALLTKIAKPVQEIEDRLDAVGDLLLAESVFQTAKGNTERAAAALRTLNSGGQPIPPEFVRTPQDGFMVHHRVGVVFDQRAATETGPVWPGAGPSARTSLNPGLNRWVARQLPPPETIAIALTLPDGTSRKLTVAQLGIEPLDFIHAIPAGFDRADQSPLALAVSLKAWELFNLAEMEAALRPDAPPVRVDFKSREGFGPHEISVFEIGALAACLARLAAESRFLAPGDFRLPGAPAPADASVNPVRTLAALRKLALSDGPLARTAAGLRQASAALSTALDGSDASAVRKHKELLRQALYDAWLNGAGLGPPGTLDIDSSDAGLLEQSEKAAADLERRRASLRAAIDSLPAELSGRPLFQRLEETTAELFPGMRIVPEIELENRGEIQAAIAGRSLLENAGPGAVDRWLQEASLVRQPLRPYRRAQLLREALQPDSATGHSLVQLPFHPGQKQPWIGGPVSANGDPETRASVSIVLDAPETLDVQSPLSGMMVDEWSEFVPSATATTGVAFHYNQPNTEPPQAMLLAVSPVEGGSWRWEYLMGAVVEALDLAKQRLVIPAHIAKETPVLTHILPALVTPVTPGQEQTPNVEVL